MPDTLGSQKALAAQNLNSVQNDIELEFEVSPASELTKVEKPVGFAGKED